MIQALLDARRELSDLPNALYSNEFYDVMLVVLFSDEWKSFSSFNAFLTHPEGLAISDLGLFQQCLNVIACDGSRRAAKAREQWYLLKERGMTDVPLSTQPQPGPAAYGGNSQPDLLRRIIHDKPELLLEIGPTLKFKSVRDAASKTQFSMRIPNIRLGDPEKVAARMVELMGLEWVANLVAQFERLGVPTGQSLAHDVAKHLPGR